MAASAAHKYVSLQDLLKLEENYSSPPTSPNKLITPPRDRLPAADKMKSRDDDDEEEEEEREKVMRIDKVKLLLRGFLYILRDSAGEAISLHISVDGTGEDSEIIAAGGGGGGDKDKNGDEASASSSNYDEEDEVEERLIITNDKDDGRN